MKRKASLSRCETYRVALTREHDPECTHKCCAGFTPTHPGFVAWGLNNPSIADSDIDDPTVLRGWDFTKRWGYGAMIFVNVNPWRSTNPLLAQMPEESVQTVNDQWLRHAMHISGMFVCGWGDKADTELAKRAFDVLHSEGPVYALRITKAGNPQHPLYLPGITMPTIWKGERYQQ